MQKKIALVTGACGFMGRRMVEILKDTGRYTVFKTDIPGQMSNDIIMADLTSPKEAKILIQSIQKTHDVIDVIFDIKGLFDYAASPEALYRVNVDGTKNLYEAVKAAGLRPRIVMWGAAGGYKFPTEPGAPIGEDAPMDPHGKYLSSKWAQEHYAQNFGWETSIPVTIIRPSGVYGPGARYGVGHSIIMAGLGMLGPIAPYTGNLRGSTVHVDDVCGAALFLAEQHEETVAGQIYNVADDSTYTLDHITRFIGEEVGFPFLPFPTAPIAMVQRMNRGLVKKAEKKGRVSLIHPEMSALLFYDTALSNEKLKKLGWKPKHPNAKMGLRKTIRWYDEQGFFDSPGFLRQKMVAIVLACATTIGMSIFMVAMGQSWSAWLLTILSFAAVGMGWLIYRLWFVQAGFANLDNWTKPKR